MTPAFITNHFLFILSSIIDHHTLDMGIMCPIKSQTNASFIPPTAVVVDHIAYACTLISHAATLINHIARSSTKPNPSAKRLKRLVGQRARHPSRNTTHGHPAIVTYPAPTHIGRICAEQAHIDRWKRPFSHVDTFAMQPHLT